MRHHHRGLEQHQAAGRLFGIDAAPHGLARERVVIEIRIVAAQRELQAILARKRSVACALIAAHLGHYRNHVVAEIPRIGSLRIPHPHCGGGASPLCGRGDRNLAIARGTHFTAGIDDRDFRIGRTPLDFARPVFLVIAERRFRQQMVPAFRAVQLDRAGENGQATGGRETTACCNEEH